MRRARAAYQVGALQAIADMMPTACGNPFPIICGTSAGALNATALAVHAACFSEGVDRLRSVWAGFDSSQVLRLPATEQVGSGMPLRPAFLALAAIAASTAGAEGQPNQALSPVPRIAL